MKQGDTVVVLYGGYLIASTVVGVEPVSLTVHVTEPDGNNLYVPMEAIVSKVANAYTLQKLDDLFMHQ
jgi:hypothetical protein